MQDIRVVVVADDPLARAGVSDLVRQNDGLVVAAQSSGEPELLQLIEASSPDVLLWDLGWEPGDVYEFISELSAQGLAVVVLLPEGGHVAQAQAAGVQGALRRDIGSESLALALQTAAAGLVVQSPELLEGEAQISPSPRLEGIEELTQREQEVLGLLAEGITNRGIAHRLGISPLTVKSHVDAILRKMGAQSRTEAVVRAARAGLITL
jgi:DNA-binding NarL/FixJ family response regulator